MFFSLDFAKSILKRLSPCIVGEYLCVSVRFFYCTCQCSICYKASQKRGEYVCNVGVYHPIHFFRDCT